MRLYPASILHLCLYSSVMSSGMLDGFLCVIFAVKT